jgi:hypothetical protein
VETVAAAMKWMLEQKDAYWRMRKAAWVKAHTQYSKAKFEERMLSCVYQVPAR